MLYIWVQYDKTGEYEPHMTFKKSDRDDADFEIQDLKDHGHRAKYGAAFPKPVSMTEAKLCAYSATAILNHRF